VIEREGQRTVSKGWWQYFEKGTIWEVCGSSRTAEYVASSLVGWFCRQALPEVAASTECRVEYVEGWMCMGIAWQMFCQVVFEILCRLERELTLFFGGEGEVFDAGLVQ